MPAQKPESTTYSSRAFAHELRKMLFSALDDLLQKIENSDVSITVDTPAQKARLMTNDEVEANLQGKRGPWNVKLQHIEGGFVTYFQTHNDDFAVSFGSKSEALDYKSFFWAKQMAIGIGRKCRQNLIVTNGDYFYLIEAK